MRYSALIPFHSQLHCKSPTRLTSLTITLKQLKLFYGLFVFCRDVHRVQCTEYGFGHARTWTCGSL